MFPLRQSIWLCRRIHLQHQFSDRHCSFVCCWLYFHNVPATHALSWCPGICPDSEEHRRANSEAPAPTQCEAHETDADGCRASCGALPQSHHSNKGGYSGYCLTQDCSACFDNITLLGMLTFTKPKAILVSREMRLESGLRSPQPAPSVVKQDYEVWKPTI